jgi:uncharacterized protein Usg
MARAHTPGSRSSSARSSSARSSSARTARRTPARDDARLIGRDDYRLTTAEILYHFPDHPSLLQTYLWQDYDLIPRFPVLQGFLTFWRENLDGRLHSVRVANRDLFGPADFARLDADYTLQ